MAKHRRKTKWKHELKESLGNLEKGIRFGEIKEQEERRASNSG